MEYRDIVKRMFQQKVNGTSERISAKDVAQEICDRTGCKKDPVIVRASYELLINALNNPPTGFQVEREDNGYHFTVMVRRVHS